MVDFNRILEEMHNGTYKRIEYDVPDLFIGITGHRPDKLGGYDWNNPVRTWCRDQIRIETERLIEDLSARCTMDECWTDSRMRRITWKEGKRPGKGSVVCFTGMAIGADQDACSVWHRMNIPFVAVIPFIGQEEIWPKPSQVIYKDILDSAAGHVIVSDVVNPGRELAGRLLHERNKWLVNTVNRLIAVYDGSRGGTSGTVGLWNYGFGKPPAIIDPTEIRTAYASR